MWNEPEFGVELRTRIGSSVLEEFVAGHGPTDVLREVVQNEFDGGGAELRIAFEAEGLTIIGSGRAINRAGWKRLDVIMGTGEVVGDDDGEVVEAKQNGIGSKNFGLRSLFLFGDRIYVRSAGRIAVLDCVAMATGQQADPGSAKQPGVTIRVPYRVERRGSLEPFTANRENEALDDFARALMPTLLKLALGGKRSGLTKVEITSERLRRRLVWRQRATRSPCRVAGVSATRRTGRLSDERDGASGRASVQVDEIEYARVVPLPPEHASASFASYFRSPQGVRICVSLPMRRNRVAVGSSGHFHYPLQAPHGRTGCAVGVSAPFRMDPDRTHVVDNDWNRWLCARAADLAKDLLTTDWLEHYGADGYLALQEGFPAEPTAFRVEVAAGLRGSECWPTRSGEPGSHFAKAVDLVLPSHPLLDGFLSTKHHLDPRLAADPNVRSLAEACGARPFTVNSLVLLRCVPKDRKDAASRAKDGEADHRYNNFRASVGSVGEQVRAARVLSELHRTLSNENRRDMRDMPATLSASGDLIPASQLTLVDAGVWDTCPVPVARRLHPDLNAHRSVARHCVSFDLVRWMTEASERAATGNADAAEREALYNRILDDDTKLPPALVAVIRRSPVVKDRSGDWAAPDDLAILPRADAALLAKVVRLPASELAGNPRLVRRLRLRQSVSVDDILGLADLASRDNDAAAGLERLVARHLVLVTAKLTERLRSVPFLPSRTGTRRAPGDLHVPTVANLACLSADDIAGPSAAVLQRAIGCREHPSVALLLERIARAAAAGVPFVEADRVYAALVDAVRRERLPLERIADQPILLVGERFVSPRECLVMSQPVRCLQAAVPVVVGTAARADAYRALGAASAPRDHHWVAVFERFDRLSRTDPAGRLPANEIVLLRDTYRRRSTAGGLPDGLPSSSRSLLSRDQTLHSLDDARAGRFLEDDFPALAGALVTAGADISFADGSEQGRWFLHGLRLRRLSEIAGEPTMSLSDPAPAPTWFRRSHEANLTRMLGDEAFATAVIEIGHAHRRIAPEFRPAREAAVRQRLGSLNRIAFVSDIRHTFRLARKTVSIPAEAALDGDGIALLPPRNILAFEHVVATVVAEVAGASRLQDVRALSALVGTLLRCRNRDDFASFLLRQGIQMRYAEQAELVFDAVDEDKAEGSPADVIVQNLVAGLNLGATPDTQGRVAASPARDPIDPARSPATETGASAAKVQPVLPPLSDVTVRTLAPHGAPAPELRTGSGGGGSGSGWRPPSASDVDRDRLMGRRGEELVVALEIERLRNLGHERPEDHVLWVSRDAPGADHDILSVADDGGALYIEVKSTTGTDGRFEWSRNELERAMREGARYQLVRVYEVQTTTPTVKRFANPAALLGTGGLRIELAALRAIVEPMA